MKIFISYVYFKSPSNDYNFQYFIENEIKYRKNVFYSIVINGMKVSFDIPKLPNVNVIYRYNIGFDFGGHKASLNYININMFDYFFFMNTGVIGPIQKEKIDWYPNFINRITDKVKLVGTTIVCLPKSDLGGFGPKVESFFFLLDRIGVKLVLDNGTIFYNHKTFTDAILNGEYALTKCIMNHGFTIDCMLKKYKNIDWYDPKNYYINDNKHPSRKNSYFGRSINPYQVIFHKWFWKNDSYVSLDIIEKYTKKKFIPPT